MDFEPMSICLNVDDVIHRLQMENQQLRDAADVQRWRANRIAKKLNQFTMECNKLQFELQLKNEEVITAFFS